VSQAAIALLYLLDTNVVSELTKPQPDAAVVLRLRQRESECAISAITLEELAFGGARLQSPQRRTWFTEWLAGLSTRMPALPFDDTAALWLGRERARLQALGRPAPRTDGELAAVAVTHGLTLVTRNRRDFEGFEGLQIQVWHSAGAGP
jgi:tRNA(fMet)-specific endonuclease VapC